MRVSVCFVAFALAAAAVSSGCTEEARPAEGVLSDYFPPPESQGGWRTLLPAEGEPDARQKAAIARTAGVDWDKLREAWQFAATADGSTALLVIRRGHVVGEWYKDAGPDKTFNIFSSSKPYTSLAFGLLLADGEAGKLPGGRRLTLDTKVCNADWLPEALPLPDPRKADITLRHLLTMTSGLGGDHFSLEDAPFETALGKTPKSPFTRLKADPGKEFHYSNAGVAHLVLLFKNMAGRDLYPYLKERVLDPVGVERLTWLPLGGKGKLGPLSQGFSGIETTAREHARFCYLALHRGEWAGKRLVPAGYYDFAWRPWKEGTDYGAQWWLYPRHKDGPRDLVETRGALSNLGIVVPNLDLVFVRLGDGKKLYSNYDVQLVSRVLAAVRP
jgi:CubicO group peptidase (beta-lactamase class C family)